LGEGGKEGGGKTNSQEKRKPLGERRRVQTILNSLPEEVDERGEKSHDLGQAGSFQVSGPH